MRRLASLAAVLVAVATGAVVLASPAHSRGGPYTIRAIFDDAAFAAAGEDVRVAGANVGSIASLGVTASKQAAVALKITDARFAPFRGDAHCAIRPQSLIGEQYVDCSPGTAAQPALSRITHGPGAGDYYLPVTHTSSPVESDVVQNISREPVRQSLAVIIDELGTGLATRGSDLNAVIHRANPALGDTDKVIRILAAQNRQLAQLATNSDQVLAPLARVRRKITGFVTQANATSSATAERAADTEKTFRLFPTFLRQLRPLMADLGNFAQQGTPVMNSLSQSAAAVGRQYANLTPFAAAARTSLINLGESAQESQPNLVQSISLANRLNRLGTAGRPTAALLDQLLTSLRSTGGIQQLMGLLFNGAVATNSYNQFGHFTRLEPLDSSCTDYVSSPIPGCSATFSGASTTSARRSTATRPDAIVRAAVKSVGAAGGGAQSASGLLSWLTESSSASGGHS